MGTLPAHRTAQAMAVAAFGVPGILLAHLLTTGVVVRPAAAASVAAIALAVAALRPARTAAGLALVTAAAQVAGHGVLALDTLAGSVPSGCLPAVGRGASLGLHLAMLRADITCPAGTLAPGPASGPAAAAVSAVLAALTILTGHALAATVTGALLRAGRRAARAADRLLTTTIAELPGRRRRALRAPRTLPLPLASTSRPQPVARLAEARLTTQWRPGAVLQRGPPTAPRRAHRGLPVRLPA